MRALVIDTSSLSTVAFVAEQVEVLRSADARHHVETLAPMAREVLAGEVPEVIVAGTGPAAFTGLRAGLVTARTLGRAWSVPVWGIGSLDALAVSYPGEFPVTTVLDARRREVYAARFTRRDDDVVAEWGPEVLAPAKLAEREGPFVGPGAVAYADVLGGTALDIDPEAMVALAVARQRAGVDLGTEPQYLRRPDIHG
ncbi:MAG: tRNA (adenosine(37)-N6)-threonylcarbamoyltransferase complex dimerization subunit type 1 TsaB [Flaviflexus sp.]|nr:tRNA (adenosine(37)-N6)-threonylcarbamoyltransferase complex dimerization subunit type 1 TsaB [Flaviflexus sp.]